MITTKLYRADVAKALYARLAEIDVKNMVPIMATERCIPRKQQAALARKLFKALALRGLSVTTPNYSMASTVEVSAPQIEPEGDGSTWYIGPDGTDYRNHSYSDMPPEVPAKAASLAHHEAVKKIDAILLEAFPGHDNRSELVSDYFDYCWSVN